MSFASALSSTGSWLGSSESTSYPVLASSEVVEIPPHYVRPSDIVGLRFFNLSSTIRAPERHFYSFFIDVFFPRVCSLLQNSEKRKSSFYTYSNSLPTYQPSQT